jgi:hypothetical protein
MDIKYSDLSWALNCVLPFAGKDEARPILNSVNLVGKADSQEATLVCADGISMGVCTIPAIVDKDFEKNIYTDFLRLFSRRANYSFPLHLDADIQDLYVCDSRYPDYRQIMPKGAPVAECPVPPTMLEAVRKISDVYKLARKDKTWQPKHDAMLMYFYGECVSLVAKFDKTSLTFDFQTKCTVETTQKIAIDVRLLLKMLEASRDMEDLRVSMFAHNLPLMFKSEKYKCTWLAMPTHVGGPITEQEKWR